MSNAIVTRRYRDEKLILTGQLGDVMKEVGGINEKVVAANRAGIKRVLPVRNRKDFEDIPEKARKRLEFIWLERVEQAVQSVLEPPTSDVETPPVRADDAAA